MSTCGVTFDATSNICTSRYLLTIFSSLTGHVRATETVFTYFGDDSYTLFNSNYFTFHPTFASNRIDPPSDVFDVCGGARTCVYDYALTRSTRIASSTYNSSDSSLELNSILGKEQTLYRPPVSMVVT